MSRIWQFIIQGVMLPSTNIFIRVRNCRPANVISYTTSSVHTRGFGWSSILWSSAVSCFVASWGSAHFIVKQSLCPARPFPAPLMGITEVVSLLSVNKFNARYSLWAQYIKLSAKSVTHWAPILYAHNNSFQLCTCMWFGDGKSDGFNSIRYSYETVVE